MKRLALAVSTPFQTLKAGPVSHKENAQTLARSGIDFHDRIKTGLLKLKRPRKLTKRERTERESCANMGPLLKKRAFSGTDEQLTAISYAITGTFGLGSIWSMEGEDNFFIYNSCACAAEKCE